MKIAICEDEIEQQLILEHMLHEMKLGLSFQLSKFSCGEDLVRAYDNNERFSVILLDMQMKGMNGIQTAERIRRFDNNCKIIIVTSILEYAVDGYKINAIDFILKPVMKEKLYQALKKALSRLQREQVQTFTIITRDKTVVIKLEEILYIESSGRKVNVVCTGGAHTSNQNITDMEQQLSTKGFSRISRYYLVNLKHIKEMGTKKAHLDTGISLVIGDKNRDKVKAEYLEYCMEEML